MSTAQNLKKFKKLSAELRKLEKEMNLLREKEHAVESDYDEVLSELRRSVEVVKGKDGYPKKLVFNGRVLKLSYNIRDKEYTVHEKDKVLSTNLRCSINDLRLMFATGEF
jgi:prefoldin subunit 5